MAARSIEVGLHHVALRTANVKRLVSLVKNRFDFETAAGEDASIAAFHRAQSLHVLRSRGAKLVIADSGQHQRANSCYDVALQVSDLDALLRRADENRIAHSGVQSYASALSSGVFSQLQSPIDGVQHTCIAPKKVSIDTSRRNVENRDVTHIDHVTYACASGESSKIVDWYARLFGPALKTGSTKPSRTYVVSMGNLGMRMSTMNLTNSDEAAGVASPISDLLPFRLVVAEPLRTSSKDQISTFLRAHQGPGVQHIAFATESIADVIKRMNGIEIDAGDAFDQFQLRPPATYYADAAKAAEIKRCGHDPRVLGDLGVLLDASELDNTDVAQGNAQDATKGENPQQRYLMQVFTKPIFKDDTLFFEVIQRCGTNGFGTGNIKALWQAVQRYIDNDQRRNVSL